MHYQTLRIMGAITQGFAFVVRILGAKREGKAGVITPYPPSPPPARSARRARVGSAAMPRPVQPQDFYPEMGAASV
jgi:hypothetical protein